MFGGGGAVLPLVQPETMTFASVWFCSLASAALCAAAIVEAEAPTSSPYLFDAAAAHSLVETATTTQWPAPLAEQFVSAPWKAWSWLALIDEPPAIRTGGFSLTYPSATAMY